MFHKDPVKIKIKITLLVCLIVCTKLVEMLNPRLKHRDIHGYEEVIMVIIC